MRARKDFFKNFQQIINDGDEDKIKKFSEKYKEYFNSPENFLFIVQSGNTYALKLIVRHIKTQSDDEQRKFLSAKDKNDRHALLLAAAHNHQEMVEVLFNLEFKLDVKDNQGSSILTYLSRSGRVSRALNLAGKIKEIDAGDAKLLAENEDDMFSRKTKVARKYIGNSLTFSPTKLSQMGRLPKTIEAEEERPYRTFSADREKQLLRHASVQLYHGLDKALKDEKSFEGSLVEVEMMHVDFGGTHSLFIAVNEHSASQYMARIIKSPDNFREMLTNTYTPARDKEGVARSKRYSSKLAARVFGSKVNVPPSENDGDGVQSKAVAKILREGKLYSLPIEVDADNKLCDNSKKLVDNIFRKKENTNAIYIVAVKKCATKLRHAEEFLSDIAERAIKLANESDESVYSSIAGKKRPCMGCFGRMDGVITNYNQYPGRFWVNTIENQTPSAMSRTVKALLTEKSNCSVGKNGVLLRDYDSGSDSEGDEKEQEVGRKLAKKK